MKGKERAVMFETVCTTCPNSCSIEVEIVDGRPVSCSGNRCPRGEVFAFDEVCAPKRVLTTTVSLWKNGRKMLLPVRSAKPVPKSLQRDIVGALRNYQVNVPVRMGDVLVEDLLGTGIS